MTTPADLIARADLAIADLNTNGGLLTAEQSNTFINYIMDVPTMLPQCRVVRMNAPEVKLNRIGFKTRILRAALQAGSANDGGDNDRYVRKADRARPDTSQINLTSKEMIAEVRLPYEVLEDNIEGRSLEEHIMRLIAERVALDLEEWALWADTAAADPFMALGNGWLKRSSVHISDNNSAGVSPTVFSNAMLALPQQYLKMLPQLRAFVSMANTIRYRTAISARATGYGDSALQNNIPLVAHGLQIEGAPMLAADSVGATGLVTFPKNLILGLRRDISVETEKDIRSREYIIVVTLRAGLQVEDTDAAVKLIRI